MIKTEIGDRIVFTRSHPASQWYRFGASLEAAIASIREVTFQTGTEIIEVTVTAVANVVPSTSVEVVRQ